MGLGGVSEGREEGSAGRSGDEGGSRYVAASMAALVGGGVRGVVCGGGSVAGVTELKAATAGVDFSGSFFPFIFVLFRFLVGIVKCLKESGRRTFRRGTNKC